jgi:signal transduction histidine kinase
MTNLMAHDLRAPLQAIQINASMLKIRQPDNAEASYIELAAQRIHQMALRIVEVQNEEQIDIEKRLMNVPVQTAIAQVAEQFELLAVSKKVSIQIEPNEQPTLAIAEPALLDNILGNLVSNAIKYSPAGGKISIKIKKLQDKVHIFIEDEGPGFDLPMEIAGDDLTLSQQASESGWGIGLKLTKQYVELMGGNLFLQTNHASGATFVVELMGVH